MNEPDYDRIRDLELNRHLDERFSDRKPTPEEIAELMEDFNDEPSPF